MKQRCGNPNYPDYAEYGGRGIRVCERWQLFGNFLADMGEPAPGMTIDRIDNDKDYEPGNCRWTDMKVQSNNTRRNHYLTLNGVSKTISEWAAAHGVHFSVYHQRVYRGWSDERVLTTPVYSRV